MHTAYHVSHRLYVRFSPEGRYDKTSMIARRTVIRWFHTLPARTKFVVGIAALFPWLAVFTVFQTIDDIYLSDSISTTMMFREPFQLHTVLAMDYHTFLFKLPLFFIEERLGLTVTTHSIVSLIFTTSMFACFGYIAYKLTKSYRYTLLALIATLTLFILIPPRYSLNNMTMPSMRNIEYGLFFLAFYWLYASRRKRYTIIAAAILTILTASDPMFTPYGVAASGIVVTYTYVRYLRRSLSARSMYTTARAFFIGIGSAVAGDLLLKTVSHIGLVTIGQGELGLKYVGGYVESVPKATELFIDGTQSLFTSLGIDAFQPSFLNPLNVGATFLVVLLVALVIIALHRRRKISTPHDTWRERYILFAGALPIITLGAYTLSQHPGQSSAIRFFHINLFVLCISVAYALSVLKPPITRPITMMVAAIFIVFSFAGVSQAHQYASYTTSTVSPLFDTVIDSLEREHVSAIAGDYWYVYPIALRSDIAHHKSLALVPLVQQCSAFQAYFIDERWSHPAINNNETLAIITSTQPLTYEDETSLSSMNTRCSAKLAIAHFGEPIKQYTIEAAPHSGLYSYRILIYSARSIERVDTQLMQRRLQQ